MTIKKNAADIASGVIDLRGNAGVQLAVSAAAAQTPAVLPEGLYDVWCDVNVYVKIAPTANDVTVLTGYLLRANNTVTMLVHPTDRIGAIAGGAGTLNYHRVG